MKSEAVLIEREKSNQVLTSEIGQILRSPLLQAFLIWVVGEGLANKEGPWSGEAARIALSTIEGIQIAGLIGVEKVAADMKTLTSAVEPVFTALATRGLVK